MKIITFISAMLLVATGAGCGTRHIYEGLRMYQETECQKFKGADQDECFRKSEMSYDEYQRQLKERQKDK